jgi:uncharacterized protein YqiB (DUF1249 family)
MAINPDEDFLRSLYNQNLPKTYIEVSELFATNFIKLSKLIPSLEMIEQNSVIKQDGENSLHLIVEEKSPYTASYILTHRVQSVNGIVNRPDIKIKVFFDANLVEVISVCSETWINQSHPFLAQCSDMDIQWELNTFLQKWLDYCSAKYSVLNWQTVN